MDRLTFRAWARPVVLGGLGAAFVWGMLTLGELAYTDHQRLTQIWNLELQRAQAQNAPK